MAQSGRGAGARIGRLSVAWWRKSYVTYPPVAIEYLNRCARGQCSFRALLHESTPAYIRGASPGLIEARSTRAVYAGK